MNRQKLSENDGLCWRHSQNDDDADWQKTTKSNFKQPNLSSYELADECLSFTALCDLRVIWKISLKSLISFKFNVVSMMILLVKFSHGSTFTTLLVMLQGQSEFHIQEKINSSDRPTQSINWNDEDDLKLYTETFKAQKGLKCSKDHLNYFGRWTWCELCFCYYNFGFVDSLIQHTARSCAKMERDDNALLLLPINTSPRGIKYCWYDLKIDSRTAEINFNQRDWYIICWPNINSTNSANSLYRIAKSPCAWDHKNANFNLTTRAIWRKLCRKLIIIWRMTSMMVV